MRANNVRLGLAIEARRKARKTKKAIWKDVSEDLLASRKNRPVVNLGEISRNSADGARVLIAGKVLGGGDLDHKVTVAAYSFSESARAKIRRAGGTALALSEFVKSTREVKDLIVLG